MAVYDAKVIVCDNCGRDAVVPNRTEGTRLKLPEEWKHSPTGMYLWCPDCAGADGKLRDRPSLDVSDAK